MQLNNTTIRKAIAKKPRAKRRSILKAAALAAAIALAAFSAGESRAQVSAPEPKIVVNGMALPTDETPIVRSLTLFAPLDESVLGALGATLALSPCGDRECLTLTAMGRDVTFEIGGVFATYAGKRVAADAAAFRDSGIVFVPAKTLFEALGLNVNWDEPSGVLSADATIISTPPSERLAALLQVSEPEPETAAEEFKTTVPFLAYTYENQTRILSAYVSGDKTLSFHDDKEEAYNNLNVRFVGLMKNGYDFTGVMRTSQTSDPTLKQGELKRLELGFSKNKIKISAYDVEPKFGRYMFRSYPIQGLDYKRVGNHFTLMGAAGKVSKQMRSSEYTRYVAGARVEKTVDAPRALKALQPVALGAGVVRVRDTGSRPGYLKQDNIAVAVDAATQYGDWKINADFAVSDNDFIGVSSSGSTARSIELDRTTKKSSWKTTHERTGSDFYSETSYFTRGRNETSTMYNTRIGSNAVGGAGVRVRNHAGRQTYIYPSSFKFSPLKSRSRMNVTVRRNFEKTIRDQMRIQDTREIRIVDKLGTSRVDASFERRKRKTTTDLSFRQKHSVSVRTNINEKLSAETRTQRERWYLDRQSVTRQSDLSLNYEIAPWVELSTGFGRYYNTPANARSTFKLGFHKVDIINDWEVRVQCQRHNYRDYDATAFELTYSFFR
ncbi:MAG: hypothetical protein BWY28_02960 [bacterium ADurb.Bin236]|nr:MAG: hypothetical protein BWY28_02960 [bacterium ADurb.Bin236]HOY61990.1 stalk domain-containing protein [bacterium]HPN94273.1 stalk domain-containing protein [bacterium]